jgi:hypothetical protein
MPEEVALATTKRKFYKALDTFTTNSQVSLAPAASGNSTSTKRPATAAAAFDEARERASKRLRHSTSSSSLPQKAYNTPATAARKESNGSRSKDPPNFSPWSHETFLARLKTFSSVSLWHPKPEAISEVEWAKRGWVCLGVNTVACKGGCERRVVVSLDPVKKARAEEDDAEEDEDASEDEAAFEQALAERYRDVIVEGHAPSCLWRKAGCKDDIYHLQIVRPSVWQPELRKRVESIRSIGGHVKDLKLRPVNKDGIKMLATERLLKDLPSDITGGSSAEPDGDVDVQALETSLHGWRGSTESNSALLHCDACFQRIGLWMYQPGYHAAGAVSEDDDTDDPSTVDLVEMHRDHCPWRNAATQKASGYLKGLNASEVLQRVVSTCARDHRRKSQEQAPAAEGEAEPSTVEKEPDIEPPVLSREEIARQDKERESRLRKIKNMFTIKRRSKSVPKAALS